MELKIKTLARLTMPLFVAATLAACGGTDSSTPIPETTPLNGKVIDGYISGAIVFLDKNRNSELDEGEPSARSDSEGAYSLPLTETDITALPTSPVVVLVGAGAKDIDTGEEFTEDNNLVLTTPPILDFDPKQAAAFSQAITPFTTQLYDEVKDTLELIVTGKLSADALTLAIDTAKSTVIAKTAAKLGIDTDELKDLLFADFLAPAGNTKLEPAELEKITNLAVSETDNLQESQQLEEKLVSGLKDNQKVTVSIDKYSFVELQTGKTLFIKEVSTKTTTTSDNGDKLITSQAIKYRFNADGTQMLLAGEPLIYEIISDTTNERADGTTTKTTTKPIWKNSHKSDDWQEYADYSYSGKPLGDFWLEVSTTSKKVNGLDVVITKGERYLLDPSTNAAKQDSEGNKYKFSIWLSTTTQRTAELSIEQSEWTNTHLDDSLFNSPEENFTVGTDELGQKVAYSVKYANDIWLTWQFPEWGGKNISNLLEVVDTQLAANGNDYSAVDITALMKDGSSTAMQDWIQPTPSFIYDAQGKVRTWYIVTNTFDGELKLHETTLPNLNEDWELIFTPGGAITHVPDGFNFENWNNITQNVNMPPIAEMDTEKGSFSFASGFGWNPEYPFHMYLDKSEAEAKLAQLSPVVEPENTELNYLRKDAAYDGWGLHIWNDDPTCDGAADSAVTDWEHPLLATSTGDNGAVYNIPLKPGATCVTYIMHKGGEKEVGGNRQLDISTLGYKVYLAQGKAELSDSAVALSVYESQKGALIDATTVAWDTGTADAFELHYVADGGFEVNDATGEVVSASTQVLALTGKDMPAGVAKRYENYKAFAFTLPDGVTIDTLVQGQLVVVAKNAEGKIIDATGMQLAPALDAVYATGDTGAQKETLGAVVNGTAATFKLWAPTAKNVALYLYDADLAQTGDAVTMTRKANGTWETAEVADVVGKYYRYEVQVYHAALDNVETLQVTDPYSLSLSVNSKYSQVVDLANEAKPADWDTHIIPTVERPEQLVIYETHLRDLSSAPNDGGTDALDGKYTAITETDRASVKQLTSLAENGMNIVHLMNLFDIATVDEDPAKHVELSDTVAKLCGLNASAAVCSGDQSVTLRDLLDSFDPASSEAQALMNDLRMYDSFNWGYDPFHYTTPEGSYATDAKGTVRIEEYRTLIKTLHAMGYRVVMDVVYNHTNSAGTDDKSVLDKIVPGYYQRLNASGYIETSTCCSNTATENIMMGKLMTDSLVTWAKEYKIDGFRFDLMGHQPKQLMVDSLAAVKAVDPDTYFYGEGWNFGEVQDDALFVQSTQANMAGTEIGTFSDRLRDAVRGGSPFDSQDQLRQNQGFATAGIWNEMQTDTAASTVKLRQDGDLIRVGMAGNLANFVIRDQAGDTKRGQDVNYNGQKAGYTADPQENISYVSKHDNQTLWDNNMYKVDAGVTSAERAQMQILALSTNMLGQGIPFFHMGSELLRSKSMQRDSYDSGDWYNTVNYDMSSNNWNVGLPREDKDGANWPLIKTIIADANAAPTSADIEWTDARFKELLKIRTSSPLFSLATEADVKARVDFQNTGKDSVAGVIVMSIDDGTGVTDLDPAVDAIVTVINATNELQVIPVAGTTGFALHGALVEGTASFADGKFTVPALTTAVFVKAQGASQGTGLAVDNSTKDFSAIAPFGDTIPYLRGSTNPYTAEGMNGWLPTDPMTFIGNGIYTVTMSLTANDYTFKIGDDNVGNWVDLSYGSTDTLVMGTPLAMVYDETEASNINFTLNSDSLVTFSFDASNKNAATLTVTAEAIASCKVLADSAEVGPLGDTNIALIGNISNWNYDAAYQFSYKGNSTYQIVVTDVALQGADGFKIRGDADWNTQLNVTMSDAAVADVQPDIVYDLTGAVNAPGINLSNNNTTLDTSVGTYAYTVAFNESADLSAQAVQGTFRMCKVAAQ